MSVSLLVVRHLRNDGDIDAYHLKSGRRYVIGRGGTAHLQIIDMRLSRAHAAIECRDGVWGIEDLGSVNGVMIDGRRIEGWSPLTPGARVQMGGSVLVPERPLDPDGTRQPITIDIDSDSGASPRLAEG